MDLITGLYRPDAGRVLVDGVPLEEVDVTAWRQSLGYVPQDTLLLNTTVARNVALADGTIDAICTDHAPHAPHEKHVEYIHAPFGILGLETAWGLIGRELIEPGVLSVEEAVQKLTVAPRRILRLDVPEIVEGEPARLTVFDASTEWTFSEDHIRSKSENTPFVGSEMVGRPWAVYSDGQFIRREEV